MRRLGAFLAGILLLAACGSDGAGQADERPTMTVLAAASLAESLARIGEAFEVDHPGLQLRYSFAGSSALAASIRDGAPGDVFVSASTDPMRTVVDADETLGEPVVVARNRLALVVPRDNPGGVRSVADLARPELTVALCAPEVPCGAAAARLLQLVGVRPAVDTYEADVKAALSKVTVGEVDAALVYVTDARAAGPAVQSLPLPPEAPKVKNDYPAVVLRSSRHRRLARAFLAYVRSEAGRLELRRAGFELP